MCSSGFNPQLGVLSLHPLLTLEGQMKKMSDEEVEFWLGVYNDLWKSVIGAAVIFASVEVWRWLLT
jgi:hypothetical protein